MSAEAWPLLQRHALGADEPTQQALQVMAEAGGGLAAEPDVQVIALTQTPAVTGQVVAEQQFAARRTHPTVQRERAIHGELRLTGNECLLAAADIGPEQLRYRAEVSASTNQQWRLPVAVDDPLAGMANAIGERRFDGEPCATALQ